MKAGDKPRRQSAEVRLQKVTEVGIPDSLRVAALKQAVVHVISQLVAAAEADGEAPGRRRALTDALSKIHVRSSHFERQSAAEHPTVTPKRSNRTGGQTREREREEKRKFLIGGKGEGKDL